MDKIIRKRTENPLRVITIENYESEIMDLAGVRVLHLFKDDWQQIHNFVINTWDLAEKPTAYHRNGDAQDVIQMFIDHECEVKVHKAGYRSVHYIIETSPTRTKLMVEIQVRTIFEEAWSEIDHKVRYPNFLDNPFTNQMLMILNRFAGNADEMSSFVKALHSHIISTDANTKTDATSQDESAGKPKNIDYTPLSDFFKYSLPKTANNFDTTISDIERLIGQNLPEEAYNESTWWTNYSTHAKSWLLTGWRVSTVDLVSTQISFYRWSYFININNPIEVTSWASTLGITEDKLKAIADLIGPLSTVIKDYVVSDL